MRWSVLFSLVVVGAAFAAPGKKIGSLRDDDSEPAKPPADTREADLALLRGLLWALEPGPTEIRVIAIEDLALLGDSRALNPLAELLIDPHPAVQWAALKSIGALRYPRSEEILTNVVRHPTLPERLKLRAIEAVLFQNTSSAIAFLKQVARSNTFNFNLQNAAKRVLAQVSLDRIEASR